MLVEAQRGEPGRALVAELLEEPVGALACVDAVVESAEPPGGVGEEHQSLGLVGVVVPVALGGACDVEGRRPVLACERLSCGVQRVAGHGSGGLLGCWSGGRLVDSTVANAGAVGRAGPRATAAVGPWDIHPTRPVATEWGVCPMRPPRAARHHEVHA
ncbi:MAG: hypothetical protein U5R31_09225 [Acidimicrobiia bacterium]|nr:hypothetical protein [Acidimicrobiia bacterium]